MAADRTVVLVGKTGNGKSSTGNSILGGDQKPFKSKLSGKGVTESTGQARAQLSDGRYMTVIDTPGLFDFSRGPEFLINEILKCFEIAKDGGVHALLVVLSLSKGFSEEEKNAVAYLIKFFGEIIKDYMIIVFTGGDQLEADGEFIQDFFGREPSEQLKEIMDMCDNKYVAFNNITNDEGKKENQRDKLISLVDEVSKITKQTPITKDMFLQVKYEQKGTEQRNMDNAGISPTVSGLEPTSNPMMRNLILVGRTGNGKSATGNSILGDKKFESKISAVGVTTTAAKGAIKLKDGRTINVIDTPGFYDFSGDPEPIQAEIINCMLGLKKGDGIHAVLVVLSLKNRFSKEEKDAISFLKACFSDNIRHYMIVVLTGGDELEANDETIDTLMGHDCPEPLKDILEMCGNRYVVMDNKTKEKDKKDEQLEKLYCLVEEIFVENGRKPYMEDITQMNLGDLNQFRRNAYMEKEQDENMQLNSTKDPKRREAEDPSGTGETKSSPINKLRTIVNSKTKNLRKLLEK